LELLSASFRAEDDVFLTMSQIEQRLSSENTRPSGFETAVSSNQQSGLKTPTEFAFSLTIHCWRVYEEIRAHSELMTKFLAAQNQHQLFYEIMDRATCHQSVINCGLNNCMCTAGHNLTKLVVQRFFNCVAKNLARHLTNAANNKVNRLPNEEKSLNSAAKRRISMTKIKPVVWYFSFSVYLISSTVYSYTALS
jgi:hypothetical protein